MCASRIGKTCRNEEKAKEEGGTSEVVQQEQEIVAYARDFLPHVRVTYVYCLPFSLLFPSLRVLCSPPSERLPVDQIASTGLKA